ncbi:MAG: ribosome silencing factor [Candidatus Binatia bacterium]
MPLDGWEKALLCTRFALDKKAYDLEILEVGRLTSVADYFLVCTGRSDTQVQAIARHIEESLRPLGLRPLAVEGFSRGQWVLIDYGDVVVHVFYQPIRDFYDLEGLWIKAPRTELPEPYRSQARSFVTTGTEGY